MNTDDMDKMLFQGTADLKAAISKFATKGSALALLKQAISGGFQMAMGKILDAVGRPGILTMNSLLSGEPTGFWHLTIGNPINPIMCIGNLICTGVDFSFPTDSLSYGDFPTKLQVKVKLKPGQPKDRAGIEMMFNMGKQRIYYAPKTIDVVKSSNISKETRSFFNFNQKEIDNTLSQTYDFISDGVKSVSKYEKTITDPILNKVGTVEVPYSKNLDLMFNTSLSK